MARLVRLAWIVLLLPLLCACRGEPLRPASRPADEGVAAADEDAKRDITESDAMDKVTKTDAEWRAELTPEQYRVSRQAGTEAPFTGRYWNTSTVGVYRCIGCDLELFTSDAKFSSGCGWPSFFEPLEGFHVTEHRDSSLGWVRTEVRCRRCDAHLGHVFEDGPEPTGLRYCINSASIRLDEGATPAGK